MGPSARLQLLKHEQLCTQLPTTWGEMRLAWQGDGLDEHKGPRAGRGGCCVCCMLPCAHTRGMMMDGLWMWLKQQSKRQRRVQEGLGMPGTACSGAQGKGVMAAALHVR